MSYARVRIGQAIKVQEEIAPKHLSIYVVSVPGIGFLMTSLLTSALEMLCLSGNVLSGIMAFNIWRIQEKTLFHKMFMVYFTFDCVIGAIDPYLLFKLFRERSGFLLTVDVFL